MINQGFCEFLEYEICKAFQYSDNDKIKGFWCDGILANQPDSYYSQKFVNDHKQVVLKAFIGENGQTEYELILKFGPKALSRYARNMDIKTCVPNSDQHNWFDIDIKRSRIEIQLN